jgi:hypothetical protein
MVFSYQYVEIVNVLSISSWRKIVLGNTVRDTWRVVLVKWNGRIFIEHGWDNFAKENGIAEGDTLFFIYIVDSSMKSGRL